MVAPRKASRSLITMIIGRKGAAGNVLSQAEFFQHLRLDVAAGDDCHIQFCFRQVSGAEEESSGGDWLGLPSRRLRRKQSCRRWAWSG